MGLFFTLAGLTCDITGVLVLGLGVLKAAAADFRARGNPPAHYHGVFEKTAVYLARRYGSTDAQAAEVSVIEILTANLWGLAFLSVGFIGQAVGALLAGR